jgi:hypothetical protein
VQTAPTRAAHDGLPQGTARTADGYTTITPPRQQSEPSPKVVTCVSRLVAAGADVKLVQAVAGHASPLITLKRYAHLLDGRITEAAARFDPARTP